MDSDKFFKNNNHMLNPNFLLNNKYNEYNKYNGYITATEYYPFPNVILPPRDYYANNKFINDKINPCELSVNLDFLDDFPKEINPMLETVILEDSLDNLIKNTPLSKSTGNLSDFDIDFIEKEEVEDYKEPEVTIMNYIFPIDYKSLFSNILKID